MFIAKTRDESEYRGSIRDRDLQCAVDEIDNVVSLYADDDELDCILANISGIPQPIKQAYSFTWYGDIVRTIILNL